MARAGKATIEGDAVANDGELARLRAEMQDAQEALDVLAKVSNPATMHTDQRCEEAKESIRARQHRLWNLIAREEMSLIERIRQLERGLDTLARDPRHR